MFRLGMIANLAAYSIVLSQPLAYLFFMGSAQRALSAPAYIELRQRINGVATTIALLCLVIDAVFMIRENGPINGVVDRWSMTDYPEDWEDYRTRWFAIFGYRQVVLSVGFLGLLAGAVFQ